MKLIKKSDLPQDKNFWDVSDEDCLRAKGVKFNERVALYDVFEIDSKFYMCGQVSLSGKYAILDKIESDNFCNPQEQNYEDELTCPYCEYQQESFELDDEEDEFFCGNCGSLYSYQRVVTVTYCSQPVKRNKSVRKVK